MYGELNLKVNSLFSKDYSFFSILYKIHTSFISKKGIERNVVYESQQFNVC